MRLFLAAAALRSAAAANPITLSVSPTGTYSLSAPGGWLLTGFPLRARFNGTWLSAADGGLVQAAPPSSWVGTDAWGAFNATTFAWATPASPAAALLEATFLLYADSPAVGFRLAYPRGAHVGGALNDSDGLAAEFPAFALDGGGAGLGYLQWTGTMLNNNDDAGPMGGAWAAGANISGGLASGPVALFDRAAAHSLLLSPSSSFMGVSAAGAGAGAGGAVGWGPLGSAGDIPAGWAYDCVAWYGATINANMMAWGGALLRRHGKAAGQSKADFTNSHLGYNTDNGAFYYYNTGAYENYSVALPAVYDYAVSQGIPYRHVLLDSYWYYKDDSAPKHRGGVVNWTAQDFAPYFTGGNAGLRALVNTTGWKIIAHNRYWSRITTYAKQNGGKYDFYVDPDPAKYALPLEQAFWTDLLTSAVAEWGLTTYEQDWLREFFLLIIHFHTHLLHI